MSVIVKQPQASQQRAPRRIWRVPTSRARWFWLAGSIVAYGGIYVWFYYAFRARMGHPDPAANPFRFFGILAYVLVLGTTAYTLRRRFVRGLPGKVQNWLWMHTWVGIITILIAFLHENYQFVVPYDFNGALSSFTAAGEYASGGALFALIFLVASGIVGRLLDIWFTRVIAQEASSNGVGIIQALEERILELEYTIERLCAGKSEPFKEYCLQAMNKRSTEQELQRNVPAIMPNERSDFQRSYETLVKWSQLVSSLHRQKRARLIIRVWRTTHIVLATLAVLVISYHGLMELITQGGFTG